jgi:serine protease Do
MKKEQNYIKRTGRMQTVVASCLATIVFGAVVGFGGSQLLVEAMRIADGSHSAQRNQSRGAAGDVDRSNLPDVFTQPDTEFNSADNNSDVSESARDTSSGEYYTAAELYEKLSDTVVGIKIAAAGQSETAEIPIVGSGVIITEDGFIITCAHVVDGADKVFVVADDNDETHEFEAAVYGSDSHTDLAIIKIERDAPFKFAKIGSSSDLRIGDTVVAIGNPVGLIKTMTQGIVSGLQRDLGENPFMLPSIQTDAALNPGNSGCPLFNMRGEIVGIVNIKLVYGSQLDNLGFAISITEAMPIIAELTQHGAVTSRPMLGITGREVSALFGSEYDGFLVETVRPGTPAARSGLSRNDIIIAINGESVAFASDIQSIMKDLNVGDTVTVTVVRYNNYGESQELDLMFALTSTSME